MKQKRMLLSFSIFVTEHPWWVLLLTLIAVSGMSIGARNLTLETDYRVYFSEENPQLIAFDEIQDTYNKSDSVLFIVEPSDGNVFTSKTLEAIQRLTEKAWKIPYSSRVDSITNFQHTQADEDDLIVADLVVDPQLSREEINKIKQVALHEPLLVNRLISSKGHVSGINVTLQLPGKDPFETTEVASSVRLLAAEIEKSYPDIKIHLTGMAMFTNAFIESAMNDNKTLVPLMYSIVILVLFISLRSFSATFSVIILILFSVVSALGIAGWLGWYLTSTSAIAPTIILTMAIADCVHILATQLHHMRIGHEKKKAIQESLLINFHPVFLTTITTAIGFLSMNFSDAPPFRDLGNIVAIGVMLAWLFSITFLPALMSILPIKVKPKDELNNSLMEHLSEWVIKYRKSLLIFNGALALAMISLVPQNQLNDEFVKYFDKSTEFRQSTDFLNENMGGLYNLEFSIHTNGSGGISEPKFLQNVQQLIDWLKTQPEVIHTNTITDTFKRLNKNMHGDKNEWYRLPENRELAAQYLLLYEMSLPYGLDLNDQINIDKSGIRIITTLESLSSNQVLEIETRIKEWLSQNMTDYKVELASPILMFSHIGSRNIMGMLTGSAIALVLISLILIVAFKSFKLGMISLIPNLIPAGVAFGIWALIDGQVGLGISVVSGMTLGIVVDDSVHFISKYKHARMDKMMNKEDAVRYTFSTVGSAISITSIVLVAGFMVLSLSHFSMNSEMGLLTAITIAVALFMDLLLLAPLLMSMEKK
ncbi:MAG TPA: RND family transporter [Methylococcaceae bacterium]|nr:RND family transporter [Methylococcaceae bacterium]